MTLTSVIQQIERGAQYRTHLDENSLFNPITMSSSSPISFGVTTRYSHTTASEEFNSSLSPLRTSYVRPAGLSEMLGQLTALMKAEDYDEDYIKPTLDAATQMRCFLVAASGFLKIAFPLGTIYADGDGGIRLEWIRPDRELRLVVPASSSGRSYLYHEQGAEYGADYSPSVAELGSRLSWLESFNAKVQ